MMQKLLTTTIFQKFTEKTISLASSSVTKLTISVTMSSTSSTSSIHLIFPSSVWSANSLLTFFSCATSNPHISSSIIFWLSSTFNLLNVDFSHIGTNKHGSRICIKPMLMRSNSSFLSDLLQNCCWPNFFSRFSKTEGLIGHCEECHVEKSVRKFLLNILASVKTSTTYEKSLLSSALTNPAISFFSLELCAYSFSQSSSLETFKPHSSSSTSDESEINNGIFINSIKVKGAKLRNKTLISDYV
ncbi:hypothetical protein V8G54_021748 [Vigna mungo]|uniref:Uncharacterized protein n=1 Tax=Vigna mungo TaxID=3915 RepID=A0AAQ3RW22_VIGMU